ncbi:nucleotidyltransferase family protein [Oceanirhabdus sp. W0125-5]|uniref:nucleotidyltransferase family protein n=1 Tax=Oceanirhabdus sp. W0125-5 TaxID=2999116 RepID=UPI0022F2B38F|nr:sugar phosphate nucleotidyltransferase [Oceanirhabdus sp. W0125-5]WBW98890.1 sugar phosphate nucleotidyltransferase [Oceanirhabdus sp. W0125-5]
MKEPILVVMAAGIGSRYGGLKQTDPVGANGELIIDYSVYDAVKAGFKKVVFIINHIIEQDFKETIGNRLEAFINVEYAFQELYDLPDGISIPADRRKPWGTAHAIYAARNIIDAPFAVINADDYYGKDAFIKIYNFLSKERLGEYDYAMVVYKLINTVTENGYVSRGVCSVDDKSNLVNIVERTHIEKRGSKIEFLDKENNWNQLDENSVVSMNMWGFNISLIEEISNLIEEFLTEAIKENPLKCEFFLPYVVDKIIKNNKGIVKVLQTHEKWYGVTYSEDKLKVMEAISKMILEGKYPNKLWEV